MPYEDLLIAPEGADFGDEDVATPDEDVVDDKIAPQKGQVAAGQGAGFKAPEGWVSPDDFKRFQSGFDKKYAETEKALVDLQQRYAQTEKERALEQLQAFEQQITSLPPERQEEAKRLLEYAKGLGQMQSWKTQKEQEFQTEHQKIQQIKAQLEPLIKEHWISQLAKEADVPVEYLKQAADEFNHPMAVQAVAKALKLAREAAQNQGRSESGVDFAEGEGAGSGGVFDMKKFKDSGDLFGAYVARDRARRR